MLAFLWDFGVRRTGKKEPLGCGQLPCLLPLYHTFRLISHTLSDSIPTYNCTSSSVPLFFLLNEELSRDPLHLYIRQASGYPPWLVGLALLPRFPTEPPPRFATPQTSPILPAHAHKSHVVRAFRGRSEPINLTNYQKPPLRLAVDRASYRVVELGI